MYICRMLLWQNQPFRRQKHMKDNHAGTQETLLRHERQMWTICVMKQNQNSYSAGLNNKSFGPLIWASNTSDALAHSISRVKPTVWRRAQEDVVGVSGPAELQLCTEPVGPPQLLTYWTNQKNWWKRATGPVLLLSPVQDARRAAWF